MPDLQLKEEEVVAVQKKRKTRVPKLNPEIHSGINCPNCFTDGKSSPMVFHSSLPVDFGGYAEMTIRYKCLQCKYLWCHHLPQMRRMEESKVPKEERYERSANNS